MKILFDSIQYQYFVHFYQNQGPAFFHFLFFNYEIRVSVPCFSFKENGFGFGYCFVELNNGSKHLCLGCDLNIFSAVRNGK